jgi:YD repeat-containing protein
MASNTVSTLLVKRATTFVNIIGLTQESAVADTLNTFKNNIPTWRGSNIVDFLYDSSQQLSSTKTYLGGFLGNNDIPLITDLTNVVTPIIKDFIYVNGKVQTTDNRYTYDTNGNIIKYIIEVNNSVNYEYDELGRLKKAYRIQNITNPQVLGNQLCSSLKTTYDFNYASDNINVSCEIWTSYYNSLDAVGIILGYEHQTIGNSYYTYDFSKPGVYANEAWYKISSFKNLSNLLSEMNYTPNLNITYTGEDGQSIRYDYVYKNGYLVKYIETTTNNSNNFPPVMVITLFEY